MPEGPTTQLLSERGTRWLLIVVLVAQLFLIAAQVQTPGGGSMLEAWLVRGIAPLGRLVDGLYGAVGGFSDNLKLRRTLLEENRRLRAEVARQRERAMEAWRLEQDLERLSRALDYVGTELGPLRAADVVFVDHRPFQRTLVLWMGGDAAERNQPVVAVDGLVGRVVLPAGSYAKVQLVTDRSASVGAMIERTRRQGVVRGVGAGRLELDFILLQADVEVGDRVALMSTTRYEWTVADYAILYAGAVTVPIYTSLLPDECQEMRPPDKRVHAVWQASGIRSVPGKRQEGLGR